MRNEEECLAKAAEMERQAQQCDGPAAIAEYRNMARRWRDVARQAAWQDAFRFTGVL